MASYTKSFIVDSEGETTRLFIEDGGGVSVVFSSFCHTVTVFINVLLKVYRVTVCLVWI